MSRLARASRNAAIAFVLGGGAAAWFYLSEVAPREELRAEERASKRLFRFGRDDVEWGELRVNGTTLAFHREPSGFVLERPVPWPADQDAVEALVDRMAVVRAERILSRSASPTELADWGLSPPAARLELRLKDGRSPVLLVGTKNPIVDGYPVMIEGSAKVGLELADFYWAFDRDPDGFRDPHPVVLDPARVVAVRVETSSASVLLERSKDAWWLADDRERRLASSSRARRLVIALTRRLESNRFVSDDLNEEGQASFGLDRPFAKVDLQAEESQEPIRLLFAHPPFGGDEPAVFVHRVGTKSVLEVDPIVTTELGFTRAELIDRTLSRLNPGEIRQIEIRLGTEPSFILSRKNPGWQVEGESTTRVESFRVDGLVRRFALLEGVATHAEQPTPLQLSEWFLDPPSRRFVFRGASGDVVAAVRFGKLYDEAELLAQREGRSEVYRVPIAPLGELPSRKADLLD